LVVVLLLLLELAWPGLAFALPALSCLALPAWFTRVFGEFFAVALCLDPGWLITTGSS
jgi:hypothetical protein